MAITTRAKKTAVRVREIEEYIETGEANTELVVTVPARTDHRMRRITAIRAKANQSTTSAITAKIDHGEGAAYDFDLAGTDLGITTAAESNWVPDGDVWIHPDDAIVVTAPAGGAGDILSISVVCELH